MELYSRLVEIASLLDVENLHGRPSRFGAVRELRNRHDVRAGYLDGLGRRADDDAPFAVFGAHLQVLVCSRRQYRIYRTRRLREFYRLCERSVYALVVLDILVGKRILRFEFVGFGVGGEQTRQRLAVAAYDLDIRDCSCTGNPELDDSAQIVELEPVVLRSVRYHRIGSVDEVALGEHRARVQVDLIFAAGIYIFVTGVRVDCVITRIAALDRAGEYAFFRAGTFDEVEIGSDGIACVRDSEYDYLVAFAPNDVVFAVEGRSRREFGRRTECLGLLDRCVGYLRIFHA